jgi:hypothetical protein
LKKELVVKHVDSWERKGGTKMRRSVLIVGIVLVTLGFLFSPSAQAQTTYYCTVVQVVPQAAGQTNVQVTGNAAWSGVARVYIDGADAGANRMVATVLTAAALGQQITIGVNGTPSWGTPLPVVYVALVAP